MLKKNVKINSITERNHRLTNSYKIFITKGMSKIVHIQRSSKELRDKSLSDRVAGTRFIRDYALYI